MQAEKENNDNLVKRSLMEEVLERLPQERQLEVLKIAQRAGLKEEDELMALLYVMGYIKLMWEDIPSSIQSVSKKLDERLLALGLSFESEVGKCMQEIVEEARASLSKAAKENTEDAKRLAKELSALSLSIKKEIEAEKEALGQAIENQRRKTQAVFVQTMKSDFPELWNSYVNSFFSVKRIARDVVVVTLGFGLCQLLIEIGKRLF